LGDFLIYPAVAKMPADVLLILHSYMFLNEIPKS